MLQKLSIALSLCLLFVGIDDLSAQKKNTDKKFRFPRVSRDVKKEAKKLEKDGKLSEDDAARQSEQVQKATDQSVSEIDQILAAKEKDIMQV